MAGMGETEKVVQLDCQDRKGNRESQGLKESLFMEKKESEEYLVPRGQSEYLDSRGQLEYLVHRGQWEKKDCKGPLACLGLKVRAHQQGEQSTLAGGGPPVLVVRELNWSTREELEGVGTSRLVELLTISACRTIHNICNIVVGCKPMVESMEWNMKAAVFHHLEMYDIKMFPVLSALSLPAVRF